MEKQTLRSNSLVYCSQETRRSKVPLLGSAGYKPYQLILELKEPWEKSYAACLDFPQELKALLKRAPRLGKIVNVNGIAPDPAYSQAGYRRIMFLSLVEEGGLHYQRQIYLVPEAEVGPLVGCLIAGFDEQQGQYFARFRRTDEEQGRDLLVCAHDSRDRCCGRWGLELYRYLRARPYLAEKNLRVWKSTHIGGHKFAPTCFELPSMRWWGQLTPDQAEAVLLRHGDLSALASCYRGFAGLQQVYEQLIECEGLVEEGWDWLEIKELSVKALNAEGSESHKLSMSYRQARTGELVTLQAMASRQGVLASLASCGDQETKPTTLYKLERLS